MRYIQTLPMVMPALVLFIGSIVWSMTGTEIKAFLPSMFGYKELGWMRGGSATNLGIATPRWAGPEGIASATLTPFNHYKVRLQKGQRVEIVYDTVINRGSISVSIFRTNLSTLLQGARVEDMMRAPVTQDAPSGRIIYTVPATGIYEITTDFWWEGLPADATPLEQMTPDWDLRYDIRWRLLTAPSGVS